MRKGPLVIILIVITGFIFLGSTYSGIPKNLKHLDMNNTEKDLKETPQNAAERSEKTDPASGPVTEVPWTSDEEFKNMQAKAGAPIQMAAFLTVLPDPLPGEEQNVHLAARILAGTVVQPGQVFSMNRTIGPYSSARGFQQGPVYIGAQLKTTIGGGVCKMATTLYNVVVLCDLSIVERHAHNMPVPYVPYGQDATVSYGNADFRFENNLAFPILIWAQGVDNRLYVAFYGQSEASRIEWHHQFLQKQKTWTSFRNNSSLPQGVERTAVEGMDGAVVKSWVTVEARDGSLTTKQLGVSSYSPLPFVIERGSS